MPWLGTFHSICVKLLRRHAELVDLKSNFTILDTDDQLRLLKQLIQAANIDDKRWPARMLAGIIDDWKNRALTPDKVPAADAGAYNNKGIELYAQYQTRLRELNAVDFGDLLLHMVTIFQTHQDVLEQYQRWFRFILVDEYQDTNVAQYLWLRLLAGAHKNICCVGMMTSRSMAGAAPKWATSFGSKRIFPAPTWCGWNRTIARPRIFWRPRRMSFAANESRLGKELWTNAEEGHKVNLIGHWMARKRRAGSAKRSTRYRAGRAVSAR